MKKKSVLVIFCFILSAALFISIFVLTGFVQPQKTKIEGPMQIHGIEKESGQSEQYLFVYGSDTVNGEINWLLETDPNQPLANNNISWKKVNGTAIIKWTDQLVIGEYNLVLRAAIKDQSLKNAKLDIVLKISYPLLTIVGPDEINDSNYNFSSDPSEPYKLYRDDIDVSNDPSYTWVVLVGTPNLAIPGEYKYDYDENISVTVNHLILWNKSVNNGEYKLKLRVLDESRIYEKDVVLRINRHKIIIKYITNNPDTTIDTTTANTDLTIPDITYEPSNPIYETDFPFTAYRENTEITNSVLWTLQVISSTRNDPIEEAKISFRDHKITWQSSIKYGTYNLKLFASSYLDLDSPIIYVKLVIPTITTRVAVNPTGAYSPGSTWQGTSGAMYRIGSLAPTTAPNTASNGGGAKEFYSGKSSCSYWLRATNYDGYVYNNPYYESWSLTSSLSVIENGVTYFVGVNGNRLKYTGDSTGDIWFDLLNDRKIHWKLKPFNDTFRYLVLRCTYTSTFNPNIAPGKTDFEIQFGHVWGNVNISIIDNNGKNCNLQSVTITDPNDSTIETFKDDNVVEWSNVNYFSTTNFNSGKNSAPFLTAFSLPSASGDRIDDEVHPVMVEQKVSNNDGETWTTIPDTDWAEEGIEFNTSATSCHLSWNYTEIPPTWALLKFNIENNDPTVTCYTGYFWIWVKFKYDYIKTSVGGVTAIIPFSGFNQPMEFYYSKNNINGTATTPCNSTDNWYYWSHRILPTTANPSGVPAGWKSLIRSQITEVFMHASPNKFVHCQTFYANIWTTTSECSNGGEDPNGNNEYINIVSSDSLHSMSYYDKNLFTNFFSGCNNLKNVYISMPSTTYWNSTVSPYPMHLGETIELQQNDYALMFMNCTSLENVIFDQPTEESFGMRYAPRSAYSNCSNVYASMFENCTNLQKIKFSFAGSLAYARYKPNQWRDSPDNTASGSQTRYDDDYNWINFDDRYWWSTYKMNESYRYYKRNIRRWISYSTNLNNLCQNMFKGCSKLVAGQKFNISSWVDKFTKDDQNNSYFLPSRLSIPNIYNLPSTLYSSTSTTNAYNEMFKDANPAFITTINNNNNNTSTNPNNYGRINTSTGTPYHNGTTTNSVDIQLKFYTFPITIAAPARSIFPFLTN